MANENTPRQAHPHEFVPQQSSETIAASETLERPEAAVPEPRSGDEVRPDAFSLYAEIYALRLQE